MHLTSHWHFSGGDFKKCLLKPTSLSGTLYSEETISIVEWGPGLVTGDDFCKLGLETPNCWLRRAAASWAACAACVAWFDLKNKKLSKFSIQERVLKQKSWYQLFFVLGGKKT